MATGRGPGGGTSARRRAPADHPAAARRPARHAQPGVVHHRARRPRRQDRKSTRLNSSHANISYAVFCLKKTYTSVQSLLSLTPARSPPSTFVPPSCLRLFLPVFSSAADLIPFSSLSSRHTRLRSANFLP